MLIKTTSQLLDDMHIEFLSLVGEGVMLDKPIKYRKSPHTPTLTIWQLLPTDKFTDRQLLATINQHLRKWKMH